MAYEARFTVQCKNKACGGTVVFGHYAIPPTSTAGIAAPPSVGQGKIKCPLCGRYTEYACEEVTVLRPHAVANSNQRQAAP